MNLIHSHKQLVKALFGALLALALLAGGLFVPVRLARAEGATVGLAAQDPTDPNDLPKYYTAPSAKPGETVTVYIPLTSAGGDADNVTCTLVDLPAQFESPAAGTAAVPEGVSAPVRIISGAKAYFSMQMKLKADAVATANGKLTFRIDYATGGVAGAPVDVERGYTVTVPATPAPATPAPATPAPVKTTPNPAGTPSPTPVQSEGEIVYESGSSGGGGGGGGGSGFKSKPKVIVSGYTFDAEKLYAGESFTMTLKLRNTSQREAVKNLQVNFSNDGGVIMPVSGGSNSIFIGELKREAGVSIQIGLQIMPDAEPKAQMLNLEITYEGTKNRQEFTGKSAIAVPVVQKTRVRTDAPVFYDEAWAGQTCSMSVQMFNMGKSVLYNCMVAVEGEGLALEETYYAGNIASGGTMRADLTLRTAAAGEIAGKVRISYEDVYGDESVEELPFTLTVNEEQAVDPAMAAGGMGGLATGGNAAMAGLEAIAGAGGASSGGLAWYWWAIIAALMIVLLVIVLLKRRMNRARALEDSSEPDDEEAGDAPCLDANDAEHALSEHGGDGDNAPDDEEAGSRRLRRKRARHGGER